MNIRSLQLIWYCLLVIPLNAQTNTAAGNNAVGWAVPQAVREISQIKKRQFAAFAPGFGEVKNSAEVAKFSVLVKQVVAREAASQDVQCAHQVVGELYWLAAFTADFQRMKERLQDLESVLASPPGEQQLNQPPCLTEWWKRLEWTYDHLKSDEPIPPDILDRFNSPEKLTAYLVPLSVSDITRKGRDNSLEFNGSLAVLIRWIVRDRPDDKALHPELKGTLTNLVFHDFQDSETGYWGQRYWIEGRAQFVPDLSTTFHVVSYFGGQVPHLDKIVATTLATKDMDSPVGWLLRGQIYNHNSMDVVELFKWGWPHATAEQKKAIAAELQKLIQRCLVESLQPDGSFKHTSADASIEDATYCGAEFLARAGYFDKSKRFWTDQDFPGSEEVRQRVIGFIEKHRASGAAGGISYDSALSALKKQ